MGLRFPGFETSLSDERLSTRCSEYGDYSQILDSISLPKLTIFRRSISKPHCSTSALPDSTGSNRHSREIFMYDFFLGSRPLSLDQEIQYLISVKRLLPRWVNSIPDSEFASIATILHNLGNRAAESGEKLCLIETGVGASTLALAFYSIKHQGIALTWDFNSKKGSEIRSACTETMCTLFDANINSSWKLIGYNSRSPYLGIGIISE